MRKGVAFFLAMVLCFGMCACAKQGQADPSAKAEAEALRFNAQIQGCFVYVSGWAELGEELEFREDGTCLINGKELKWEVQSKIKSGYSEAKDFADIYDEEELVYEASINIWDDGAISLVISHENVTGNSLIPVGTYVKAEDHTHDHG